MKILIMGGYGNISWNCTNKALEEGHDVWILNRGVTHASRRTPPNGAIEINVDARDIDAMQESLKNMYFDVVCDFICYNAKEAKDAISIFKKNTGQYIVISSAANYDRKNAQYPLREDCLQSNDWIYAKNKIEMEKVFWEEYKKSGFPITIVRPGQTYDTLIPDALGRADWTIAQRIISKKPIILFGDGTTLWTLTHSIDFANAFIHLFANRDAIGEAFHITSNEWLNWNQITQITAETLGVNTPKVTYMPTDFIEKVNPELASGIKGHKMYCDIYDNSKIKSIAPSWSAKIKFQDGIKASVMWLSENPQRRRINEDLNISIDKLIYAYNSI